MFSFKTWVDKLELQFILNQQTRDKTYFISLINSSILLYIALKVSHGLYEGLSSSCT
jgi:hypothetical protein